MSILTHDFAARFFAPDLAIAHELARRQPKTIAQPTDHELPLSATVPTPPSRDGGQGGTRAQAAEGDSANTGAQAAAASCSEAIGKHEGDSANKVSPASSSEAVGSRNPSSSEAIGEILACRREQVERWGHTAEADLARPVSAFLADVQSYASAAREDLQFNEGLPRVRRRLVRLAAFSLAAIDRIDAELALKGSVDGI